MYYIYIIYIYIYIYIYVFVCIHIPECEEVSSIDFKNGSKYYGTFTAVKKIDFKYVRPAEGVTEISLE